RSFLLFRVENVKNGVAFMSVKDPSLDYEPLRRRPSKVVADEDEFSFKKPAAVMDEWKREPEAATKEEPKAEPRPLQATVFRKHGHSDSYAGILLITAYLFFRPYEWSTSLF